ncbi:hypothetical protein J31TS4_46660 [Paenibacillus sp. J31TS4]|uniref:hypothetical protein n=1 Tax=Paenibacillus sp. J31TS4 TaxID=2807195 RepID=UPI001B0836C2|nr:hypothetical protein [Paenibacillus sp. J31TS4]GIP41386.1 hypothetical protein J31TS4_46660 [Paenibacillus sp. J31TS4]
MDRGLAEHATIYNYTLLKKLTVPPLYASLSIGLLLAAALYTILRHGLAGLAAVLAGAVLVPLLQAALTKAMLRWLHGYRAVPWGWMFVYPWLGYLPAAYIRVSRLFFLQLHLLVAGAALLAVLYIWLPAYWFGMMAAIHLWLLAPRLVLLWKLHGVAEQGMVKLAGREIALYRS